MNTPIISPIWFYMMDVVFGINAIAALIIIGVGVTLLMTGIECYILDGDNKKINKNLIITLAIAGVVTVIIPSQDTMMKMLIAQNITYERVEGGKEMVKDTVDYIFEKIDESKEGEK